MVTEKATMPACASTNAVSARLRRRPSSSTSGADRWCHRPSSEAPSPCGPSGASVSDVGFLDKAKKLAEQAREKAEEAMAEVKTRTDQVRPPQSGSSPQSTPQSWPPAPPTSA